LYIAAACFAMAMVLFARLLVVVCAVVASDFSGVRLNNGVFMPTVSLGTAGYNDSVVEGVLATAASVGFVGVDTAFNYYNQKGVGLGLARLNRSAVFVISKTTPCFHPQASPAYNISDPQKCMEQTRSDIESDLQQLNVKQIDLLLLHGANHHGQGSCGELACRLNIAQWKVYEEYYAAGKVRAIGVSNYCPSCLDCLIAAAKVIPAVNQFRLHVGMGADPEGFLSYGNHWGIVTMAYSPMGGGEVFTDPLLKKIGSAHNKTAAQVALKWVVAKGATLATKSSSPKHLKEDLDLFSWELAKDDVSAMDAHIKGSDVPSWACTAMDMGAVAIV